MKKTLLEIVQVLTFSIFVGIAVYGAIIYWGGQAQEKLPASSSLLLGLGAVICIIVIVVVGNMLDKIAIADEAADNSGASSDE